MSDTGPLVFWLLLRLINGNVNSQFIQWNVLYISQLMGLWYLPHRRPAKALASLRIRAVWPAPSLFAHIKYGNRRRVRPNIKDLATLDGCASVFEEWVIIMEDEKRQNLMSWLIYKSITVTCIIFYSNTRINVTCTYEPRHDKTNKMAVRQAKTQLSLGIRMPRLSWVFAGRRLILLVLSCRGSYLFKGLW